MFTKAVVVLALLMLAVVVAAQQAGDQRVIDIRKVEGAGRDILRDAKTVLLAFNYIAVAIMLGATAYVLLVRKRSFPELFGEWWFWLPIALNVVPIILYLLSDITPLVNAVYDWVKRDQCPFLYCP
jgi:hypothetical protein